MKLRFLFVLTVLLNPLLVSQAQVFDKVDSLKRLILQIPDDTNKVLLFAKIGWTLGETNSNTDLVQAYADSIRLLSEKLHYENGTALSHFYYGFNEAQKGNFDKAVVHLNTFIEYFSKVGDNRHVGNGLYQLAKIQDAQGNYSESLSTHLQFLKLAEATGSSAGISTALNGIASVYFRRLSDNDRALDYYRRALSMETALGKGKVTNNMSVNMASIGSVFLSNNEMDSAAAYFNGALAISRKLENDWSTANALESLGTIEHKNKNYKQALSYRMTALAIREKLSQKHELAFAYSNIGYTYLMQKEYAKAQQYLMKSLPLAREIGDKSLTYDVYFDLSTITEATGNYADALKYHQLYASVKDSVLNETSTQQLSELKTKFESEEKDKQIELLAKEKEIQQQQAERRSTLNNIIIGGLIVLVLVAMMVLLIIRQRLQLNKKSQQISEGDFKRQLSELEIKALRAQINPHFLFNCMNAINSMLQQGKTEEASRYLVKFSRLVRLILENAEHSAVALENEMKLLESYIQLEELRFTGTIDYKIEVDDGIDQQATYLPSMILQPVIENAIWHGIIHKTDGSNGSIQIDITQDEDMLICVVEDNGVGREKAKQYQNGSILKSKSLGIKITEDRLRLLNRKPIESNISIADLIDIDNTAKGTRVTVRIPIAE